MIASSLQELTRASNTVFVSLVGLETSHITQGLVLFAQLREFPLGFGGGP